MIDPGRYNPEFYPEGEPTSTFWMQATPGTSYARCLIPARELGAQALKLYDKDLAPQPLYNDFGERIGEKVGFTRQKGKAAIWQFPGNITRGRIIAGMIDAGIRTLVEVDDNYTVANPGIPGVIPEWKHKQEPGEKENTNRLTHKQICSMVDGIIVSTPWLEQYYQSYAPVFVCDNAIEPSDWQEPEKIDDGILRIGYAYSTSHYYDLEYIHDSLYWASREKDVEIILLGPNLLPTTFSNVKFTHIPWVPSLPDYRRTLQLFDVGLCPVRPGDWHNARSDIKMMEYAMAGAMGICSPAESYKPWWDKDGEACLIPERNRAKDFTKKLKWILSNRDAVPEFAAKAKEYVMSERLISQNIWKWQKAIEG